MGQLLADVEKNKITTKALVLVQEGLLSSEKHRFFSGCSIVMWLDFVCLGGEN